MAFDPAAPINRRTVAKGIAWSVPAVAVAGAAPAFAISGPTPTLVFQGACKWPGNSCQLPNDKSYGVTFLVTNSGSTPIYLEGVSMTVVSGDNPGSWTPRPAIPGPCYSVGIAPNNTELVVFRFENSTSSANLKFVADVTVAWGHNCPVNTDQHGHLNITQRITVPSTRPNGDCTCAALAG